VLAWLSRSAALSLLIESSVRFNSCAWTNRSTNTETFARSTSATIGVNTKSTAPPV